MKGCTDEHRQGKKNSCLSSNGGKIAHILDTVAWKKECGGERKGSTRAKLRAENPHVSVSQAPVYVFFMSCSKGASSGTNATKSSPCVCRTGAQGILSARQSQGRLHPVPSRTNTPVLLICSHSHDPGVPKALLRATCKGSWLITVLSLIAHRGKSVVR